MAYKWICNGGTAFFMGVLILSRGASASDQVGTLTQIEGEVKLFTHPSKSLQKGDGMHAFYEGEYYLVEEAKLGSRVERGNIVRTAPGAKARVVFENGDQLNVGAATAMRVFWNKDAADASTRMDLAYGKIRGVVEKGGPRSHLQIRTRTATMGVRGTDFFIADGGSDGGTEVSIMRGAVEVTPKPENSKPIQVKQGMSADIPAVPAKAAQAIVEVHPTTQEELKGILRSSVIEKKPEKKPSPEIAKLETKAIETTLKDIRTYDPAMYAQLESRKPASTDEINAHVIQSLMREAPKAPENHKPHKSELDHLDQGAYEKYFKTQE